MFKFKNDLRQSPRRWVLLYSAVALTTAIMLLGLWLYQPDLSRKYLEAKYAGPPSRFMRVNGLRVHYRDQGRGPAVVLLHGLASSLHAWDGWTRVLDKRFRVVRMDLPAFGLTGPNPARDYSYAAYDAFLTAFLDKLGIETCALAGNSLGGGIAWAYAWRHPKRVSKLILVDPAGLPTGKPLPLFMRAARLPLLRELLRRMALRGLVRTSLQEAYADPAKVTPALVDRYYELILGPGVRGAVVDLVQNRFPDQAEKLALIKAPTLIMWGEKDPWMPAAQARIFARQIPRSRVILYPGVGHAPMEETPVRTAEDALKFLEQ